MDHPQFGRKVYLHRASMDPLLHQFRLLVKIDYSTYRRVMNLIILPLHYVIVVHLAPVLVVLIMLHKHLRMAPLNRESVEMRVVPLDYVVQDQRWQMDYRKEYHQLRI